MDDEEFEVHAYFDGCTCDHDEDEHSWGSCNVEGCDCEGGWTE